MPRQYHLLPIPLLLLLVVLAMEPVLPHSPPELWCFQFRVGILHLICQPRHTVTLLLLLVAAVSPPPPLLLLLVATT
jgi:hypothetical protein